MVTMRNNKEITVKTFIGGDMFLYLVYFMKNFFKNDEIVFNSIKITRNLILKSKNYFYSKKKDSRSLF
jgi:hypothetical protein